MDENGVKALLGSIVTMRACAGIPDCVTGILMSDDEGFWVAGSDHWCGWDWFYIVNDTTILWD